MGRKALWTPSSEQSVVERVPSLSRKLESDRAWTNPNDDGSLPDRAQAANLVMARTQKLKRQERGN